MDGGVAETTKERIAERVRFWRRLRGLTQEALALETGVDRTFVSQIERGVGNPSALTLCRLAERLGVHPASLMATPEELAAEAERRAAEAARLAIEARRQAVEAERVRLDKELAPGKDSEKVDIDGRQTGNKRARHR